MASFLKPRLCQALVRSTTRRFPACSGVPFVLMTCSQPASKCTVMRSVEFATLEQICLDSCDKMVGLDIEDLVVGRCIVKAPCGDEGALRNWGCSGG